MTILAYFLALISFGILNLIINSISIVLYVTLYTIITKKQDGPYHFFNQFIGTFNGCFFASLISHKIFYWLDITPNVYLLTFIYTTFWFLTNLVILDQFQPFAQRLGTILGLILFAATI